MPSAYPTGQRFFGIVPVSLLYLLLNVGVMATAGRYGSLRDIPFLLTFTYNWLLHALTMLLVVWLVQPGLSHLPVPGRVVAFVAIWAVTMTLAYLSFRWIESRIVTWSRHAARLPAPLPATSLP